jgi:ABC-2 type transport system ATP-binding protein
MNIPAIEVQGLTKTFGALTAVNGLNLSIPPGEIFAFLGPNGAGKTTTVKLMGGVLRPTSGSVTIAGFDVAKEPMQAKQVCGFVAEQPFIYPQLTGFEFMRFVGDLYKVPAEEQEKKIPELLSMFELSEWSGSLIESYSHGMKQKLVLASTLLHKPQVLFLDEPLVGLDPKSARLVKDIFQELAHRGVAIFMCTHVLEIAERLAHRVGIINKGTLIALETVEDMKKKVRSGNNLEDVFLELTGGTEYADLLRYL